MVDASFVFTRDLLGLDDLEILATPLDSHFLLETFGRPGRVPVNSVASSSLTHGDVVIRSRLQQATIPFSFFVLGDTSAAVETRVDAAEACFSQFIYAATVDIDGTERVYSCDPSPVQSELVLAPYLATHCQRLSVVLSVYPLVGT